MRTILALDDRLAIWRIHLGENARSTPYIHSPGVRFKLGDQLGCPIPACHNVQCHVLEFPFDIVHGPSKAKIHDLEMIILSDEEIFRLSISSGSNESRSEYQRDRELYSQIAM